MWPPQSERGIAAQVDKDGARRNSPSGPPTIRSASLRAAGINAGTTGVACARRIASSLAPAVEGATDLRLFDPREGQILLLGAAHHVGPSAHAVSRAKAVQAAATKRIDPPRLSVECFSPGLRLGHDRAARSERRQADAL